MPSIGTPELIIVAVIAILLYGKELPSVMRNLGKSMMEFKKGLKDVQDEFHKVMRDEPTVSKPRIAQVPHDYDEPTAPKFEPPAEPPKAEATA